MLVRNVHAGSVSRGARLVRHNVVSGIIVLLLMMLAAEFAAVLLLESPTPSRALMDLLAPLPAEQQEYLLTREKLLRRLQKQLLSHDHHQEPEAQHSKPANHYIVQSFAFAATSTQSHAGVLGGAELPENNIAIQPQAIKDLTLCTQCTPEHLRHVELSSSWFQGPVSVAVFSTQLLHDLALVFRLRRCAPNLSKWADVHLIHAPPPDPAAMEKLLSDSAQLSPVELLYVSELSCEALLQGRPILNDDTRRAATENAIPGKSNYRGALPYPNNFLRNIARKNARTSHIVVLDVDMVPSPNLRATVKAAIETEHPEERIAWVIPAFETDLVDNVPRSKEELLHMYQAKTIQPFYHDVCWKCQKWTDYDRWISDTALSMTKDPAASYEVQWHDPWEPFYAARNDILPLYDSRFMQYGFNRISQVCETHVAGFDFRVLTQAYTVHLGVKKQGSFHAGKQQEQERNRQLFRTFKKELVAQYPASQRHC